MVYRVLHVEDDADAATITAWQLDEVPDFDCEIEVVKTRAQAISALIEGAGTYDVVLLDLRLPDANGVDTLADITTHAPEVAVVALTAQSPQDAFDLLSLGASDFLLKTDADGPRLATAIVHAVERKKFELELRQKADSDALTGIGNRRFLSRGYRSLLARRVRTGGVVGVAALDLDGFKAMNDTHGHAAGDEVLRAVARVLAEAARAYDVVARVGGDEFVVATLQQTTESAEAMMRRIHRSASDALAGTDPPVGVSMGVVVTEDPGTLDELLWLADSLLYDAKGTDAGVSISGSGPD